MFFIASGYNSSTLVRVTRNNNYRLYTKPLPRFLSFQRENPTRKLNPLPRKCHLVTRKLNPLTWKLQKLLRKQKNTIGKLNPLIGKCHIFMRKLYLLMRKLYPLMRKLTPLTRKKILLRKRTKSAKNSNNFILPQTHFFIGNYNKIYPFLYAFKHSIFLTFAHL